jgi:hypothetical protein
MRVGSKEHQYSSVNRWNQTRNDIPYFKELSAPVICLIGEVEIFATLIFSYDSGQYSLVVDDMVVLKLDLEFYIKLFLKNI